MSVFAHQKEVIKIRKFPLILFALAISAFTSCGGGGGGGSTPPQPSPPVVSITISPTTGSIEAGQSVKLTVTAQNTAINWPSTTEVAGSFTRTGNEAIWTPPAIEGTYEFTATAAADASKKATARITVTAPAPAIAISADKDRIRAGQSVKLTVTAQNTGVTWPLASEVAGSFTRTGNEVTWTPPAIEGTYGFTVKAAADASKTATAQITVFIPTEDPVDTWYSGINNNGRIVGGGNYSDGTVRAFAADGASLDNLDIFDHPDAYDYTYAIGINYSGHILGYYENGYFLKTGSGYQAIEDYHGYVTDYTGINSSGQLSGYFTESDGYAIGFIKTGNSFSLFEHPDVSDAACFYGLPCGTWITGINNHGHIVGVYTDSAGLYRSFRYDGGYTPIDHPDVAIGMIYTWASDINDSGQAVGYFWDTADNTGHGFAFAGSFEIFDHPGAAAGGEGTYILGINNSGQIVGWYDDGDKTAGFLGDL